MVARAETCERALSVTTTVEAVVAHLPFHL
jgi:hypothetical protein